MITYSETEPSTKWPSFEVRMPTNTFSTFFCFASEQMSVARSLVEWPESWEVKVHTLCRCKQNIIGFSYLPFFAQLRKFFFELLFLFGWGLWHRNPSPFCKWSWHLLLSIVQMNGISGISLKMNVTLFSYVCFTAYSKACSLALEPSTGTRTWDLRKSVMFSGYWTILRGNAAHPLCTKNVLVQGCTNRISQAVFPLKRRNFRQKTSLIKNKY